MRWGLRLTGPGLPVTAQESTSGYPPAPNRRTYAILAAAAALFIAYGSIVPLSFRERPPGEVLDAFVWAMTNRVMPQSRVDALTNLLVGIPLGFFLLAMSRVDRDNDRRRDVLAGACWLPACAALGAAVEFAQLYLPSRTCASSDVILQTFGAAGGMLVWILFGRGLTRIAREIWTRGRDGGTTGRILLAYLLLIAFIQSLPLDLNPSPKGIYRKVRDEARFEPFVEFQGEDRVVWAPIGASIKLFGLFLPAGLLASRHRRLGSRPVRMIAFAVVVAVGAEAIQVAIRSRTPAATDAIVGAAGIVVGWLLGRLATGGISVEAALILGQIWAAALLIAYWQPFEERWPARGMEWTPGMPMQNPDPLITLFDLLQKPVLFAPLGVLVAALRLELNPRCMLTIAAGVGVLVAAAIEFGQRYLESHYPGTTDIMLGGLGGFLGAWLASRVR